MTAKSERIVRYTAEEIDEMIRRGEDMTDWARIDAMTDEQVEANVDYEDEGLFDHSRVYAGPHTAEAMTDTDNWHASVYLTAAIVDWFREHYPDDYRMRMNAILRHYIDGEKRKAS